VRRALGNGSFEVNRAINRCPRERQITNESFPSVLDNDVHLSVRHRAVMLNVGPESEGNAAGCGPGPQRWAGSSRKHYSTVGGIFVEARDQK